jgi:hypothetical protein
LSNFDLKKNDFDLYSGFSMKKTKPQNSLDLEEELVFNLSGFLMIKFQEVAKNIEGFCFSFSF